MIQYILIFFIVCIVLFYNYRYSLPKHIWVYWDTPRMPDLIQKIQNYNLTRLDGWTIHSLNSQNLHLYINQNEYQLDQLLIQKDQRLTNFLMSINGV